MRILILDIETAPNKVYTWGRWKQNVALNQIEEPGYTLCWAAKWFEKPNVYFRSIHHDGKEEMLRGIYDLLGEADVVLTFNGLSFDIPILSQEFLKMGWTPPSPSLHIDLLQVVKKRFRLLSNKLEYVLTFLGMEGKVKHEGFQMWLDCMAGNEKAWVMMKKYNIGDVRKMEPLYVRLLPWITNHPNHGLFMDGDEIRCPNCGSTHLHKRGKTYTATMSYQRYRCVDCGSWSKSRTTGLNKDERKLIIKGM